MNNLEQDLGCKLFIRTNLGISLTPEGLRLYGRAAAAFEQLRLGESEIAGIAVWKPTASPLPPAKPLCI